MSKQDKTPKDPKELIKSPDTPPDTNKHKIDIDKAIKLRTVNGLTLREIADVFGCAKQSVHQQLSKYIDTSIDYRAGITHLSTIVKAKGLKLLSCMTEDKIKEMSGLQLMTAFGISVDKAQLLDGKPTQNIQYLSVHTSLEELQAREQAVQDELDSM